jgi:hypothetical protein
MTLYLLRHEGDAYMQEDNTGSYLTVKYTFATVYVTGSK